MHLGSNHLDHSLERFEHVGAAALEGMELKILQKVTGGHEQTAALIQDKVAGTQLF